MKKLDLDYKKIWSEVITASLVIIISAIAIISFIIISDQDVDIYNNSATLNANSGSDKIKEILSLIESKYIGEVNMDELVDAAINGIFETIDDPYTRYLTEEEYNEEVNSGEEKYTGIGIHISWSVKKDALVIIGVMPNTPAKEAGLKSGDIIKTVNNNEVNKDNYNARIDEIKGVADTTVDLAIERDGKLINFTVKRANIVASNIESNILENNIGYIKILQFSNGIYNEFKTEYDKLIDTDKVDSLIIDLRNNPGGLVNEVLNIANMLVGDGIMLKVEYGDGTTKVYNSNSSKCNIPLVVLVNENSASASEILAGCVKDLNAGTVIGTTTFGKGIMQSVMPLEDGGGVSITVAKFYTASMSEIHGKGIVPDIEIELPEGVVPDLVLDEKVDTQLKKAIEHLTK